MVSYTSVFPINRDTHVVWRILLHSILWLWLSNGVDYCWIVGWNKRLCLSRHHSAELRKLLLLHYWHRRVWQKLFDKSGKCKTGASVNGFTLANAWSCSGTQRLLTSLIASFFVRATKGAIVAANLKVFNCFFALALSPYIFPFLLFVYFVT